MNDDREQRIRERAYALWEEAGRPEGEDLSHWVAAFEEVGTTSEDEASITENTSVLGEPGSASANGSKPKTARSAASTSRSAARKSAGSTSPQISTGEEPARAAVRHTEGP